MHRHEMLGEPVDEANWAMLFSQLAHFVFEVVELFAYVVYALGFNLNVVREIRWSLIGNAYKFWHVLFLAKTSPCLPKVNVFGLLPCGQICFHGDTNVPDCQGWFWLQDFRVKQPGVPPLAYDSTSFRPVSVRS